MPCPFCHQSLHSIVCEKISFRETCPFCSHDLHCCWACHFYDRGAYNECREPQADRVLDKERANFCEYFSFDKKEHSDKKLDPKAEAKKKLEELFGRK